MLYNGYGNHFFEKLIYSIHPDVILDFDDDISTNSLHQTGKETFFQKIMMEDLDYFDNTLLYYNGFIAGSNYLKNLILTKCSHIKNEQICVIPTCVDYDMHPQKKFDASMGIMKFGWIGGNQNLPLLEKVIPALNELSKTKDIELIVISGVSSYPFDTMFPMKFVKYDIDTEVENLKMIDIGLMPLNDDLTSRGKCGFKLIQYMGLGIPGIADSITVNKEIIDDNENGWLIEKDGDWLEKLKHVAQLIDEFDKFGKKASVKIKDHYSFNANINKYVKFVFGRKL